MCVTDDLFLIFEPLITMDSIQYANGSDGRQRRKLYDQSYTHQAIIDYYDTFQQVLVTFIYTSSLRCLYNSFANLFSLYFK